MKVAYNACYGGFSLSEAAVKLGRELSGDQMWCGPTFPGEVYDDGSVVERFYGGGRDLDRTDPILIKVIERLGQSASTALSNVKIAYIPPGAKWRIDEYDGSERVMTIDDYDWNVAVD